MGWWFCVICARVVDINVNLRIDGLTPASLTRFIRCWHDEHRSSFRWTSSSSPFKCPSELSGVTGPSKMPCATWSDSYARIHPRMLSCWLCTMIIWTCGVMLFYLDDACIVVHEYHVHILCCRIHHSPHRIPPYKSKDMYFDTSLNNSCMLVPSCTVWTLDTVVVNADVITISRNDAINVCEYIQVAVEWVTLYAMRTARSSSMINSCFWSLLICSSRSSVCCWRSDIMLDTGRWVYRCDGIQKIRCILV